MSSLVVIIIAIALIVAAEAVMWISFEKRHASIRFPRSVDRSFFRFLTAVRLRLLVVGHTVLLCVFIAVPLWLLW